jgi:hypothetical protein
MIGGIGFGMVASTWTAIALVAPSVVTSSLSASPSLRTADPFAPKMTVASNRLPVSALVVDDPARIIAEAALAANQNAAPPAQQVASADAVMPALVSGGSEAAKGSQPGQPAPAAGPVLASLTPYANDEVATPTISTVTAVNVNPAAPDDPAVTGSIQPQAASPQAIPLPPQRDAALAALEPTTAPDDAPPDDAGVAGAGMAAGAIPLPPERDVDLAGTEAPALSVPLPPASPVRRPGPVMASLAPVNRNEAPRLAPAPAPAVSVPSAGGRTAIYDISAHTVYLPNGERLEAHSGLGGMLDDPGSVHVKNRGATPPTTYDLSMREQLFHGVAALRLTPAGGGGTYGRVGLLAHTYMLGPRGDSNGCVSFRDYNRFLKAYRSGEVTKLAVVPSLSRSGGLFASRAKKSWWWFASSTD